MILFGGNIDRFRDRESRVGITMKIAISLVFAIVLGACSTVPLDDETRRYAAATSSSTTALSQLVAGYNQDARRASFAKLRIDPNAVLGDDPKCDDAARAAPVLTGLPTCFNAPTLHKSKLKPATQSIGAIAAYARILSTLIDEDGLSAAKTQATALKDSLASLNTSLQSANVLGASDPYGGAVSALSQAVVRASNANARAEAIEDRKSVV